MGIDATIYFESECNTPDLERFPQGNVVKLEHPECYSCGEENPTHTLDTGYRYYGRCYERGPWPQIAACLLILLMSKNVKRVWYGGDCGGLPAEITVDDINEMNKYYVENGHRPYRS